MKAVASGWIGSATSFFPKLYRTRVRVSAMAISQNIGVTITALLPALFAAVTPPGSANVPLTVGAITFGVMALAAGAAYSARETFRIPMADLGDKAALWMGKAEYKARYAASLDSPSAVTGAMA